RSRSLAGRHEPRATASGTGFPRGGSNVTGSGTGPALDMASLQRYVQGRIELAGPLTARLLAGGKSNLSFAVDDGTHSWVLRRPPLGPTLATAHDMAREYRVQAALADSVVP